MKTITKLTSVLILMLATFSQSITASAGGGGAFHFKDQSALAQFSSADSSGCIMTDVYLWGSEEVVQDTPGKGSPSSETYVLISQYDVCTGLQLLSADGMVPLSDPAFQVSKKFESATLNATVNLYDYVSGATFDVNLDLTWMATGALTRQNTHSHSHTPGCNIVSRINGTSRPASVSGSVSSEVANFTPAPSYYAVISSLKSGNVVTGCN